MTGIYLSGTGNTKHCVEKMLELLDERGTAAPIEDEKAVQLISDSELIILGYPTQFSNAPVMVRDFIKLHANLWKGKKVFCITTLGLFSGDGTGCTARILKKYGANIVGGLQIRMPDSICDSKLLKKTPEENQKIIRKADRKIEAAAGRIKAGDYPREGLSLLSHIAGLLGQRLWFYGKTQHYSDKLKINKSCTGCGLCAKVCPMSNITMIQGKPVPQAHCTMCYRCISQCPQKAMTLLGKEVMQ